MIQPGWQDVRSFAKFGRGEVDMRLVHTLALFGVVVAAAFALSACRTAKKDETFNFDQAAHQRAVELKSKAVAAMANSGEAYSRHRADVEALNAEMEKAYELSAAGPDNATVAAEWAAMKDPGRDLYGGFASRWRASGTVDQAARDAAMNRVTGRFDYILCLEAAKRTKAGICKPPEAAAPAAAQPDAALPAPPPA
jgi:hypothetical protein